MPGGGWAGKGNWARRAGKANKALSSDAGRIGQNIGGQFLGDYRQRRNTRNKFEDLKRQGLTPWEIGGGGFGGGVSASQGNTLGNAPQVQARSQQAFQANENDKNRATATRNALIAAQAGRTTAATGQQRFTEDKSMNITRRAQMEQGINVMDLQMKKLQQETRLIQWNVDYAWEKMFATMSQENGMWALIVGAEGGSVRKALSGKGISQEDITTFERIIKRQQSNAGISAQWKGVLENIRAGSRQIFDINVHRENQRRNQKLELKPQSMGDRK